MLDVSTEVDVVKNLPANFKIGHGVLVRVVKMDKENGRLDLSLRGVESNARSGATPAKKAKLAKSKASASDLTVGSVVPVKVMKVLPGVAYVVQLSFSVIGRVHICDVSDSAMHEPLAVHKVGDVLVGYIESMESENVFVSLRPSRTGLTSADPSSEDLTALPQVQSLNDLTA